MPEPTEWGECAHCGRLERQDDNPGGFDYIVNAAACHVIICPCGIFTRPCNTKDELQACWLSRPGKQVLPTTIKVKHPPPRGMRRGQEKEKLDDIQRMKQGLKPDGYEGGPRV